MFERFSANARTVVVLAQEESRRLHHTSIGTEHLLLGLLGVPDDPAVALLGEQGLDLPVGRLAVQRLHRSPGPELDAAALDTIGIDLDAVRAKVESVFGAGALSGSVSPAGRRWFGSGGRMPSGHIPFTPDAKKSLEFALREARALENHGILPGHLLLGLFRAEDTPAARLLRGHGFDLAALRESVQAVVRPTG